jgi:uncharacterized repeat protein (TIGR01451 family)
VAAGYGTGTILHADALRTGEHALVDVDVAFSGAAFSQATPPAAEYTNEVHRTVSKLIPDNKISYGRGTALELGLGSDPVPLIGQLSEASAPVSTDLIHKVIGPIGVPGLIRAELLRSQARARARTGGCPLGRDAGYGLGSVLNLELLGGLVATNARYPYREVSQSNSTTRIVQKDGRKGLKSETRQTIAPVTFFKGTPLQFTVEVLGEWALRAIAYGNESSLHYGPLNVTPQTPVVRILDATGKPIFQVTTQMLLGKDGLDFTIPNVAEIVIGEDPRMIGDNASSDPIASPTEVAAAADVVRVKLFDGKLADVRVGHMEAGVTVPANGVQGCPGLIVDQTVDKPTVTIDDVFTYTITITNPNDCDVTDLKLVETPTADAGVTFSLAPSAGGSVTDGVVTYADIGTLGPGESKTVTITSTIPPGSAEGLLKALAVATGICPAEVPPNDTDGPNTPGTPESGDTPVEGEDAVNGPNVDVCVVPNVVGEPKAKAIELITQAGCVVKEKTGGTGTPGEVTEQGTPPNTPVPLNTPVEITIAGPALGPAGDNLLVAASTNCTVPGLIGMSEAEARTKVEAAGCVLVTEPKNTANADELGKVLSQTPGADTQLPRGSVVNVKLGVQVLGATETNSQQESAAPALVRTGGVALGGLALWLLFGGLATRLAGSERLWRLARRRG